MIQASPEFASAIEQPSRRFVWRLKYNDTEIEGAYRSLSVHKGACSTEAGLFPGSVYASYITAVIDDLSDDISDKELELQIGLEEPDNLELEEYPYDFITVGLFTPTASSIKKTAFSTSFTAGGRITSKMQRMLPQVNTASLAGIAQAITTETGVPVLFSGVASTTPVIEKSIEGITCYEALALLATMAGGYAAEDSQGNIIISAYTTSDTVSMSLGRMNSLPAFEAADISVTGVKVVVQEASEDEEGTAIPEQEYHYPANAAPVLTIATPYMTRQIFDNIFAPDIIGYTYRPGNIQVSMGDPRLEPFDTLVITDLDDTVYYVPCHEIVHTWDGGLMTEVNAAGLSVSDDSEASPRPITEKLERYYAELITAKDAIINRATIKQLNADTAIIRDIQIGTGSATNFSAVRLEFDTGLANTFTAAEITALNGIFDSIATGTIDADNITAKIAAFEQLAAGSFTADQVMAASAEFQKAMVGYLQTRRLDADYAKINFLNVDFSQVNIAKIGQLFSESGVIQNVVTETGQVTGELAGVTIRGDLIEGNTIKADKLVILGSDGLYYKLNTNGATVESQQTDYNSINGSHIQAQTITASKIAVTDLVAFGATIGGLHIENGSIHSTGKTAVDSNAPGLYFDSSGQFNTGDASNFIASWYDAEEQKWKVAIRADQISFGSGEDVQSVITGVKAIAENTLIYDHIYEYVRDANNKPISANFTAFLYRGGVDVKTEQDESGDPKYPPESFTWYLKREDKTTGAIREEQIGTGYTCSVNLNQCGYGAEVIGKFSLQDNAEALATNGNNLTTAEDEPLTVRATGDSVRVRDLTVSTTIFPSDKLMVVGGEDEHLVTIQTLQDYLNANLDKQVLFNTTAYWDAQITLVSDPNTLYIYTDHQTDSQGNHVAGIKAGDGNAYVVDLPFTDAIATEHIADSTIHTSAAEKAVINSHMANSTVHITAAERAAWNEKVRCYYAGTEQLVFTTA